MFCVVSGIICRGVRVRRPATRTRRSALHVLALVFVLLLAEPVVAATPPYTVSVHGSVQGYRLAGVEPDGDPLYQVVLRMAVPAAGGQPALNLIISSYLENFQPDTTPVLPDLLHPTRDAQNLGGFLQGKALLTDDAGTVLYIGSFLGEAFLDNTNNAVITFSGSRLYHGGARLAGTFALRHVGQDVRITGRFSGQIVLSSAARRDLRARRGATMRPIKDIIRAVTVVPFYYGKNGVKSSGKPLHTAFRNTPASSGGRHFSLVTILAGAGAVVALLLAGVLYLVERRQRRGVGSADVAG